MLFHRYHSCAICMGNFEASTCCYFWSLTNWKACEQHIAWNCSWHSPKKKTFLWTLIKELKLRTRRILVIKALLSVWIYLARGIPGVWQKRPTAAPGVENFALGPATTLGVELHTTFWALGTWEGLLARSHGLEAYNNKSESIKKKTTRTTKILTCQKNNRNWESFIHKITRGN